MSTIADLVRRRSHPGTRVALGLLTAVALLAANLPVRITLAQFTGSKSVGGNTLSTGTWGTKRYNLHNIPTPPTGNTTAQFYAAMDATGPTAGTLYNYDTNCSANTPGRDLQTTANGIYETAVCKVANWIAATRTTALTINGQAQVVVWSATANFMNGTAGNVSAVLADYNVGAGTVALITSAVLTQANWQAGSGTWVQKTLTFPSVNYTVATGHQLEVRLVASTAAAQTMWVAYDTAAYQTYLLLP